MPVLAAKVDHFTSPSADHRPPATRPIVRMIDGPGLGVQAQAVAAYPPTKYTFCFCTCVPPVDGGRADGPGKV